VLQLLISIVCAAGKRAPLAVLLAGALAACQSSSGTQGGESPGTLSDGREKAFPRVQAVPQRPQASTAEDRQRLLDELTTDRTAGARPADAPAPAELAPDPRSSPSAD
jgi:hypothetical protein